jgi:hypothetical protein
VEPVDGITFNNNQAHGKHRSKPCELRKENKRAGDDDRIRRLGYIVKVQPVYCFIDFVEVIDRNDIKLEELIAQIKINECKVDHKKDYRKCESWIKNEKDEIKKEEFHPICYDVQLSPKNCFLIEEPRKASIRDITDPMNSQADIVIRLVHFHDR